MMTTDKNNREMRGLGSRGFTLIELMIVIAILGALAAAVGVYISADDAKMKSFAFNLGSRFKQAKFEAIKRGHDVFIDFDCDTADCDVGDGVYNNYTVWLDNNDDGQFNLNPLDGDMKIGQTVPFDTGVAIYDSTDATIVGGPGNDGPKDKTVGDGVPVGARFRFQPSGDSISDTLYVYFYRTIDTGREVSAGPWAIIVSSVGRIRLDEWRNGKWKVDQ